MLTEIKYIKTKTYKKSKEEYWLYKCVCGTEKIINKRAVNEEKIKSCGCLQKQSIKKLQKGEASFNALYSRYRSRSLEKNVCFDLTKECFRKLVTSSCFYCLQVPRNVVHITKHNGDFVYNGIDRVDNKQGYSLDNCVTCCEDCNRAKLQMSKADFFVWIKKVYNEIVRRENEIKT